MRNLLALLAAAVLAFLGLGWYLDWYHIKSSPEAQGHTNVNIDFDRDKIVHDVKKGEKKIQEAIEKNRPGETIKNEIKAPKVDIKPPKVDIKANGDEGPEISISPK